MVLLKLQLESWNTNHKSLNWDLNSVNLKPVNVEHWLKSKLAWPVCTKNIKLK